MKAIVRLGIFLLITRVATMASANAPEGFTFVKTVGGISEYTLDSNGNIS